MEELKNKILIKKNELYTGETIKNIYDKAVEQTLKKPTGDFKSKEGKEEDIHAIFALMLSGIVLFHELENNLFDKEEKEDGR